MAVVVVVTVVSGCLDNWYMNSVISSKNSPLQTGKEDTLTKSFMAMCASCKHGT